MAGLLFTDAHAATANMVLFTRFQNIVLAVAAGLGWLMRIERIALRKATEDRAAEAERTREEERLGVWRRSACASRAKSTTSRRIRCRRSAFRRRLPSA